MLCFFLFFGGGENKGIKGCPPSGAQTSKPCDLLGWTRDPLALQNIWMGPSMTRSRQRACCSALETPYLALPFQGGAITEVCMTCVAALR